MAGFNETLSWSGIDKTIGQYVAYIFAAAICMVQSSVFARWCTLQLTHFFESTQVRPPSRMLIGLAVFFRAYGRIQQTHRQITLHLHVWSK